MGRRFWCTRLCVFFVGAPHYMFSWCFSCIHATNSPLSTREALGHCTMRDAHEKDAKLLYTGTFSPPAGTARKRRRPYQQASKIHIEHSFHHASPMCDSCRFLLPPPTWTEDAGSSTFPRPKTLRRRPSLQGKPTSSARPRHGHLHGTRPNNRERLLRTFRVTKIQHIQEKQQ